MSVTLSSRKRRRYASDWQTQVSISNDHTLRSRVKGNFHARFWIGGGGSNPFADHTKERTCAPLINISLEELVPQDHFYRHLERTLDLSFVREFVQQTYAGGGRPSIDPVVFFKLQLVMFFEDIRSERLLMRHAADRLSVRWYLGYDLNEPLPDHSSLTRIRERYGVEVFRRFFDRIVEQCQAAGLVWGKELYFDGTKVAANAGKESLKPRFYVEAHLESLFGEACEEPAESTEQESLQEEKASRDVSEQKD